MKIKLIQIIAFVFTTVSLSAQSNIDKWVAMKDFHAILSQTFHPVEEGNLAPIKLRSEEFTNKANDLLQFDIPEEFRTKELLTLLENLQFKSKALRASVLSAAPDEEITKSITEIHTIFHQIIGLCRDEKK